MSNIASALKAEIIRVSRKEIRTETEIFKTASAKFRSETAALKQRIVNLEKTVSRLSKGAGKAPGRKTEPGKTAKVRFTAKGLISLRRRLGLSANEMGLLVGVSAQTVYNWEAEKSRPRPLQVTSLASLRGVGKKAVTARLLEISQVTED